MGLMGMAEKAGWRSGVVVYMHGSCSFGVFFSGYGGSGSSSSPTLSI